MNKTKNFFYLKFIKNRFIFLIPLLTFFVLFVVIPVLLSIFMSFTSASFQGSQFIGLSNYQSMISDSYFWNSLIVTIEFAGMSTILVFIISLGIALLVQNENKFSSIMRVLFYLPYMTPLIVAATMWKWMLNYNTGIINFILTLIGLPAVDWLNSNPNALLSVIMVQVWGLVGFMAMLFVTGLQSIPSEFKEAAIVDGANKFQTFFSVTFPLLKNTSILVLVLSLAYTFGNSFALIYIMTTGGPGYGTTVTPLYIYQTAFTQYRWGYASTLTLFLLAMAIAIGLFALRVQNFRIRKRG
jgi:alpha-1,4-digalacturonate transport system permease protein